MRAQKPNLKPERPYFSSGPCCKRPGWTPSALNGELTSRSHRSSSGRESLKRVIEETKQLLDLPAGYEVAIVPGSDTGAFEMAMWNLLGARGADVFAWDVFGRIWLKDAIDQLRLDDLRTFDAPPGELPDFSQADFSRDVLFTWNGTTTGVKMPDAAVIPDDREGLTFCDATSAIFAEALDFRKLDCVTYSWQKVLGGEGAHGMLILSPRALERLAAYRPRWPIPKVFRLTGPSGVLREVFEGVTINTPSMLCVEDCLDALAWARSVGGADGMRARAAANARLVYDWIDATPWAAPLAVDPATRSNTSVCVRIADRDIVKLGNEAAERFARGIALALEKESAAFDIAAYRGMPAGFRIWCGATVEQADIAAMLPWLSWAYDEAKASLFAAPATSSRL